MKVNKLVPDIYFEGSRDFSYVGRIFEVLFNYLKTGVDLVNVNPLDENAPSSIITLLASTLGFESKHEYNLKDLISMCSAFASILKIKGTKEAIQQCINVLLYVQNMSQVLEVQEEMTQSGRTYNYIIYVPLKLQDTILLEDLFEYILPVGTTYEFRHGDAPSNAQTTQPYEVSDSVVTHTISTTNVLSQVSNNETGTSSNTDESSYTNRSMVDTSVVDSPVS